MCVCVCGCVCACICTYICVCARVCLFVDLPPQHHDVVEELGQLMQQIQMVKNQALTEEQVLRSFDQALVCFREKDNAQEEKISELQQSIVSTRECVLRVEENSRLALECAERCSQSLHFFLCPLTYHVVHDWRLGM